MTSVKNRTSVAILAVLPLDLAGFFHC